MKKDTSVIEQLKSHRPVLWLNPYLRPAKEALHELPFGMRDIEDAEARLRRFAPLLQILFEDLRQAGGIIESKLIPVADMLHALSAQFRTTLPGNMLVKADHALPVAGSVKARGGIYEVLCAAERAAVERGLIGPGVSYESLAGGRARDVFGEYTIAVGSTGNLGLSVGIMGAALGFKTAVHMSAEAKAWKKDLLKKHGVLVVEHEGDYSAAVRSGREAASRDPRCHFVDDENSAELFLGYSVAALRMKEQLFSMRIPVDPEHPLFVYIPCGVGGAPGGITFGLKHVFGDAARCFFAEPVESPSMMLRLASGPADDLSVYDIGLENRTAADGLAVPKASRFAADMVRGLVDGCFTVSDNDMFRCVYLLEESTGLRVEPSAAAGFMGPLLLSGIDSAGVTALKEAVATGDSAHHAVWTTGGSFVPVEEFDRFREHGRRLCEK